jgi:ACS family hexuronate transporter-like MFS transporter
MPVVIPDLRRPARGPAWKWWVCGLLLLATTVNYMDRLTLNQMAVPIMDEFGLQAREYGQLESAFGIAFALGAILAGWLVDRWNVRWVYPAAVLVWSLAGFLTGLAQGFASLLVCRFLLGLAEAGNWPCALRTTQLLLKPGERTLGNSILQSGAALGAVLTPLLVLVLYRHFGTWRYGFMAVGAVGLVWVAGWLLSVRGADLDLGRRPPAASLAGILGWLVLLYAADLLVHLYASPGWVPLAGKAVVTALGTAGIVAWLARVTRDEDRLPRALFFRRFAVLAVLVVSINITWHFFRAWLPLFLQKQHGYSLEAFSYFSLAYYFCTDLGCLAAGFATLALVRGGVSVHASRVAVFSACALLTAWSVAAAVLPAGPLLLGLLLLIGFAALGLFPNYYSFSQELTVRHQGKLTGALGCICWMAMALLHEVVGDAVERTGSYSAGVAVAGLLPLAGVAALALLWGKAPEPRPEFPDAEASAPPVRGDAIRLPAETALRPAPADPVRE